MPLLPADDLPAFSNEQYRSLVALLPDPVLVYIEFAIVFANEAAARLLGVDRPDALIGRSIFDFLPPDHHESTRRQIAQLFQRNRPSDVFERRLLRLDGRDVWTEVRSVPTAFRGRSAVMMLARDITERKRLERTLLRSEERLHRILRLSPDAVTVHTDGIIRYANDAALRMFRAEWQDVIGRPFRDFLHADFYEGSLRRAGQAIESGAPLAFETVKMVRADGDLFDAEVSSVAIDGGPGAIAMQTVIRDVTEQIAYEKQLLERTRQYRRLIEFLPEPIVVSDPETILYANQSAVRLLGADKAEALVGRTLSALLHPDDREASRTVLREVMRSDEPTPFAERRLIRADGEAIAAELSSIRIDDYDGRTAMLSVFRDLTERKQAEDYVIRSEKLSIIGQLAAGIAHEIRNPLTALKGFTQLLMREVGTRYTYLDTMMSELDRIHHIVDEFMSLAKPQIGSFRPHRLELLLRDVVSLLEAEANLYNVRIELAMPAEPLPAVPCSENRMKQVFVNTLKNAIQAMPEGGTVRIAARIESDRAVIGIQDEGEGIPEEIIRRIGEPFFTTKSEGTGLGLMVCHRILEAHRGHLRIESEPGVGTTVHITLPLAAPHT